MRHKNLKTPSLVKKQKVDLMAQTNPNHEKAHLEAEAWLREHPKNPLPPAAADGYQSLSDRGWGHFAARFLRPAL